MTYSDVSGGGLLYTLVIAGLLFMVSLCIVFYIKSYRRAIQLGISRESIAKIHKNTLLVTIVPSLAVIVGLVSLTAVIGIPWSWFRLSVVGDVSYELIAAELATSAMGFTDITSAAQSEASTFCAIMFVMSMGIIAGVIINALFGKQIITGVSKLGQSKSSFGQIINGSLMLALMAVLIPFQIFQGKVATMVLISSVGISYLLALIGKKMGWSWLGDFVMAFTLLLGMASAVLWTQLF